MYRSIKASRDLFGRSDVLDEIFDGVYGDAVEDVLYDLDRIDQSAMEHLDIKIDDINVRGPKGIDGTITFKDMILDGLCIMDYKDYIDMCLSSYENSSHDYEYEDHMINHLGNLKFTVYDLDGFSEGTYSISDRI